MASDITLDTTLEQSDDAEGGGGTAAAAGGSTTIVNPALGRSIEQDGAKRK